VPAAAAAPTSRARPDAATAAAGVSGLDAVGSPGTVTDCQLALQVPKSIRASTSVAPAA